MSSEDEIQLRYRFAFQDEREYRFGIRLDATTLKLKQPIKGNLPDWTRLEFMQCEFCPLDPAEHTNCPAAAHLYPIVQRMGDVVSTEPVRVTVASQQRTVGRSCAAQDGLSSLIGVTLASSGCPHTAFLRPMARFHLPFSDLDETTYRAASSYMLAQYFRASHNQQVDLKLTGLRALYQRLSSVNQHMASRLRSQEWEDGVLNAIVILDMFAQGLPSQFDALLDDLEHAFEPFMDPPEAASPIDAAAPRTTTKARH